VTENIFTWHFRSRDQRCDDISHSTKKYRRLDTLTCLLTYGVAVCLQNSVWLSKWNSRNRGVNMVISVTERIRSISGIIAMVWRMNPR